MWPKFLEESRAFEADGVSVKISVIRYLELTSGYAEQVMERSLAHSRD